MTQAGKADKSSLFMLPLVRVIVMLFLAVLNGANRYDFFDYFPIQAFILTQEIVMYSS